MIDLKPELKAAIVDVKIEYEAFNMELFNNFESLEDLVTAILPLNSKLLNLLVKILETRE